MARTTEELTDDQPDQVRKQPAGRQCRVCDVKLSSYNPNPYCWQHMIGQPWRGPTAKPKF
ncbi:MAG TPA: hypothetical protein VNN79_09295 [Actinomycetota bacterium]|nr:hypothetical protein [Actinomycetota bacterium]